MHKLVLKVVQWRDHSRVPPQEEGQIGSTRASPWNILVSAALQRMFGELQHCCTVKETNTKTRPNLYSDHVTKQRTIIPLFSNYCRFTSVKLLFRIYVQKEKLCKIDYLIIKAYFSSYSWLHIGATTVWRLWQKTEELRRSLISAVADDVYDVTERKPLLGFHSALAVHRKPVCVLHKL